MARTAKPKAPAPTETSPKVDSAAAAGVDNAPVTPDATAAPPIPPPEVVPPVEAGAVDAAQDDVAGDAVVIPDQTPPAAAEPVLADDPRQGFVLRVRALQPVRWRIGRQFTAEAVETAAESLTEDQMQALMGDPLLAVDVIAPE